jgi:hypothetical protein
MQLCVLIVDEEFFKAGTTLDIDAFGVLGVYLEGETGKGEPKVRGLLSGKLELQKGNREIGAQVEGVIKADILRLLQ